VVLPERADEPKLRRFLNWIVAESRPDRDAEADQLI
jgi:LysR family glycine cleavage system transcriptional activator